MIYPTHTAVKGRARYRIPALYRAPALKRRLEQQIAALKGVQEVSASEVTGTVLIMFDPEQRPQDIAARLQGLVAGYQRKARSSKAPLRLRPESQRRGQQRPSKNPPNRPRHNGAQARQKRAEDDKSPSVVYPIHTAVKGRARYKVPALYRAPALRRRLEKHLAALKGIQGVSASEVTGTVLILFDPGQSPQDIAARLHVLLTGHRGKARSSAERPTRGETLSPDRTRRQVRTLVSYAKRQPEGTWHRVPVESMAAQLGTDLRTGLSTKEAEDRLHTYGPNLLPESIPRSDLSILLGQFQSLPVALLGVAAGISLFTGGLADALVIAGVVAINAAIAYTTESQSEQILHSLKHHLHPHALVRRDGAATQIRAEEVVPGDVIVVKPGSYIIADARVVTVSGLNVDESVLTGESMPVTKAIADITTHDVPLADRVNMLYMGTLVTNGHGEAVVVATGRFTEMGKIQTLVGETASPETPIEQQLNTIGRQLVVIAGSVCGLVFIVGLFRGYGFLEMLKASISLAVAAVPEGLPTIATTTLAIGIHRLREQHVLIRKLSAVETLGCVETICLDKTGTLTANRMKVLAIVSGMRRMQVTGEALTWNGSPVDPFQHDELLRLLHVAVLCSDVEIEREGDAYVLQGSPTETALIHAAILAGVDPVKVRATHPLMAKQLRAESRNFMSTVHHTTGNNHRMILVKGSPAEVLQLCRWHLKDGARVVLTDDDVKAIEMENDRLGGQAMRVLGAAFGDSNSAPLQDTNGGELVWLGLFGMADPIRDGIKDVIQQFHCAGIDTVMITGDQSPTAYAIGKALHLAKESPVRILDSTHLAALSNEAMVALAGKVDVYARVSPASKLQIVQALQQGGKVVAMTGDGINDGPALKAADIGIAMGRSGTDVAREVADVVIEDDQLGTMIVAVGQGRTIYNNIRKSVHFLLATNLSEIIVMFVAIAAGLGQPLSPMQLLWINLMSDIAPGLALALEPPEADVLSGPPRRRDDAIFSTSDFGRTAFEATGLSTGALASYGYGLLRYGPGPHAHTACFTSLTMAQLLHAVSCRSERHTVFEPADRPSNPYLTTALCGSFMLQGLTLLVPGLRGFLGLAPLPLLDAAIVGATAVLPFIVNEASKS